MISLMDQPPKKYEKPLYCNTSTWATHSTCTSNILPYLISGSLASSAHFPWIHRSAQRYLPGTAVASASSGNLHRDEKELPRRQLNKLHLAHRWPGRRSTPGTKRERKRERDEVWIPTRRRSMCACPSRLKSKI